MAPMTGGEITSPNICCTKIDTPLLLPLNSGGITFVMRVEMGAKLHHTQHSPRKRSMKVTPALWVRLIAKKMNNAAGSVKRAGTMKNALLTDGLPSKYMLAFDPATVPTIPPTAVIKPTANPAIAKVTPS